MKNRTKLRRLSAVLLALIILVSVSATGSDTGFAQEEQVVYSDWVEPAPPAGKTEENGGTADLSDLLWDAALLDGKGNSQPVDSVWTVTEGSSYQLSLRFRETPGNEALQFRTDGAPLVYPLPTGITAGESGLPQSVRFDVNKETDPEAPCVIDPEAGTLTVLPDETCAAQIRVTDSASFEVTFPVTLGEGDVLRLSDSMTVALNRGSLKPLTAEGPDYLIHVWPLEGTHLPAGTVLNATEIQDPEPYEEQIYTRVGIGKQNVRFLRVFDLSLTADGKKIEPDGPVRVEMRMAVQGDQVAVVHFSDRTALRGVNIDLQGLLKRSVGKEGKEIPVSVDSGVIRFDTDGFSAYAVVGYRLEETVIASDGVAYLISVTYGLDAEIPENSTLSTAEVLPDDPAYAQYQSKAAEAMGRLPEDLTHLRLFDIHIQSPEGEIVEPKAPVTVRIDYADPAKIGTLDTVRVVHIMEDGTEVLLPDIDRTQAGLMDAFTFEAASFSLYAVAAATSAENLGGKAFLIVQPTTANALQGENLNATNLKASHVTIRDGYVLPDGQGEATVWTFVDAGNGQYYLQADNGQYMNITGTPTGSDVPNGAIQMSDTPQALNVTAGTGTYAGRFRITNTAGAAVNLSHGRTAEGFGPYNDSGTNEWHTLYETTVLSGPYEGQKISVQEMEDAMNVIIYRSVYKPEDDTFEDYVIDGNGNLVRAYDKGNQLTMYSAASPVWNVVFHRDAVTGELNGYYDFYNQETGMYLCPRGDGTLVSSTMPGVTLNGRRDGEYYSTIESWDNASWAWYGYHITENDSAEMILTTEKGDHSQNFSFASVISETTAGLHTVPTVDSTAAGIKIQMFNYPNRSTIANITGSDSYGVGVLPKNHVRPVLNADGYPVFTNGRTGQPLFDPGGSYYKGDGNHLFLSSVYNSTGYYEYNAFHNFAHYNGSDFTVYQEIGTPSNSNNFYFKRGNFFPFNDLDASRPATNVNQYDGSGTELEIQDPTLNNTLYLINSPDFYFGMTAEATFMQPRNGTVDENPVLYEFNGDDDLWIFIDGVLILDIGGVHDAWPGTINFATGEIHSTHGGAGGATTIRQAFKNAGVFPDGTAWDDSRADEYFKGETFVDYSSHTFKMFYMEHGAGASNLEMRFNLPVIEKGRFTVEKELKGTDQERFSNVDFAYQAFTKNENGADIPLTEAVYEGTSNPLTFYDNVHIDDKVYDNVFYLKPGQSATFPEMPEETEYWVRELGVGLLYYDKIEVNDVSIDGIDVTDTDGTYPTSVATVAGRARVVYGNTCADTNLNELRITKRLAPGSTVDGSTFEFRVLLENAAGNLVPYSTGSYMIRNDAGEYFHYVNGVLTSNGMTPIEASVAGNNGTIAGIPVDYTVVINELLVGTDFYVEEIRNPEGWFFVDKVVTDCDSSDLAAPAGGFGYVDVVADGQIALGKDAKVVIRNRQADPVSTYVQGAKILNGRDLLPMEFTFLMEPVNLSGEVIGEALVTRNELGGLDGEKVSFTFRNILFTLTDYKTAAWRDADGNALFYYVVREQISEDADEDGFDPARSLAYDLSEYLVVFRVSYDKTNEALQVSHEAYPYDGGGIPSALRPPEA